MKCSEKKYRGRTTGILCIFCLDHIKNNHYRQNQRKRSKIKKKHRYRQNQEKMNNKKKEMGECIFVILRNMLMISLDEICVLKFLQTLYLEMMLHY